MGNVTVENIIVKIKLQISNFKSGMRVADKRLASFDKAMDGSTSKAKSMGVRFKQSMQVFSGWAMSLMFAGMALQRLFSSILKSSFKTFQEVVHSVGGAITQIDIMNAQLGVLKFISGQALEPLMQSIIPVIMKMQEWIETHPKLFRGLIKWGLIIGTVLMILGMFVLGMKGFIVFVGMMLSPLKGIITLFQLWNVTIASTAALTFGMVAIIVGLVLGFIILGAWIFKLKKSIGGWGEFFKSVLRGVLRVLVMFGQGLWDIMVYPLIKMVDLINMLIRGFNKLTGMSLGQINLPEWVKDPAFFLEKYLDWEEGSKLAPSQGYASGGGLLDPYSDEQRAAIDGTSGEGSGNTYIFNGYNNDELTSEMERLGNITIV